MEQQLLEEQLVAALLNKCSSNPEKRVAAQVFLDNMIATEYAALVLALSRIMADEWKEPAARTKAGLQLQNVVYSPDTGQQAVNEERWFQLHMDIRDEVKAHCLDALLTMDQRWDSAARCVSRLASMELRRGRWPQLMDLLVDTISGYGNPGWQAHMSAIGYICSDLVDWSELFRYLHKIVSSIFRAIEQNNFPIAAVQALRRVLVARTLDEESFVCYAIFPRVIRVIESIVYSIDSAEMGVDTVDNAVGNAGQMVNIVVQFMRRYYDKLIVQYGIIVDCVDIARIVLRCQLGTVAVLGIDFWSVVCQGILDTNQAELSDQERSQLAECQSQLCGALQSAMCKIDRADAQNMADQIMPVLMAMLERANNNENPAELEQAARSLLPQIISIFRDLSLLSGASFAQYRGQVIETLIQACQAEVDLNDPDTIDVWNLLRRRVMETLVGLIQGARSSGSGNQYPAAAQDNIEKFRFIIPHMDSIIPVMEHIAAQQVSSEELIGATCQLVGVIATALGEDILQSLDTESIRMLLQRGRNSQSADTQRSAARATKETKRKGD